ncbi:response regulator transcription factor [Zobellia galactanivorans]|uniref:Two-component system-Response regulator n=2 Tax=Zobellia TaxID=112040 RepID=G0L4L3_ZOBGA|nr:MULTISPECIES: response regulator transcription factor [Zobellia]MBU3025683.1 response regulator transcription factor [Zobellia galactanivorans]MDO6516938.1 response regulator transcription factor [Zobellia uliginosa]MDO6808163.1 response regulator transcription factor [Zobellia galactanivorans]OWW26045.1 DNA-binding response regulator [Zobellia sp. OII3]CAZ98768.1 Two-component system-Response regulator [Zobellia galactanivorans]
METNILKIIVIDNDLSSHESYQKYFESYTEYSLKGIYVSVKDALAEYDTISPDIVFSEVALDEIDGIEGIKLFRKKDPKVKIIMLSAQNNFDLVKKAFKNTANGYLSKPVSERTLYNALDSIKSDGATMSNDIIRQIISKFQRKSIEIFSERENQVIDYLSQGATYKTIAEKLFVTASAINFHVQNIYLKLDVNSKSEALRKLQELEYANSLA